MILTPKFLLLPAPAPCPSTFSCCLGIMYDGTIPELETPAHTSVPVLTNVTSSVQVEHVAVPIAGQHNMTHFLKKTASQSSRSCLKEILVANIENIKL